MSIKCWGRAGSIIIVKKLTGDMKSSVALALLLPAFAIAAEVIILTFALS